MAEILLVNPRKRVATRRKKVMKKRRTAAQRAATRKMIAANRARGSSKRRRRNPVAKANPARRRRRKTTAVRRRSTRRRRNPSLNLRSVQNQVMEAGIGAVGAVGLGVIQGYLPIPANLKTGIVGTGVKALLAIGMGVVAQKSKLVGAGTAAKMANGALTVVLYDALKTQMATFAPGIKLGAYLDDGLGYYGSGYPAGVADDGYGGMGVYLPEIQNMNMGMEQTDLGAYAGEPEYFENMSYTG